MHLNYFVLQAVISRAHAIGVTIHDFVQAKSVTTLHVGKIEIDNINGVSEKQMKDKYANHQLFISKNPSL